MQHKLSTDVQRYANRRRRNTRHRLLGCVAGILVFCITYAALLPAISQAAPYISEAVKSLVAPTYEYNPSDKYTSYTYSDNDIDVVVQLPADSNVPKDAILRVTPIKETNAQYASLASKAEKAVNGAVKQAQFYDISFYTERMEYIPVDDRAKVSINYSAPTMDVDSDIVVLHYDENDDNPITLDKTDFTEEPYTSEQELTFETDGFSVFAVVELTTMYQTVKGITGLENKSYIIAAVNNGDGNFNGDGTPKALPVMTSTQKMNGNRAELVKRSTASVEYIDNKVTSVALTDYTGAVWNFEKAGTDTYYIKSSGEQYLSITEGIDDLTLSDDKQEFRVVPATNPNPVTRDVTNAVCIETDVNGTTYRVNLIANDSGNNFTSWNSGIDARGNHLVLVEYTEPKTPALTNLAGKSYIIAGVNFEGNYKNDVLPVLTSNKDPENGNHLASRRTEGVVFQDNQVISVALSNYADAVWTFEDAGDGKYFIQSSGGEYLYVGDPGLYLGDVSKRQEFEVVTATNFDTNKGDATNAVCIHAVGTDKYVNIAGNYPYIVDNDNNRGDFTGYNPTNGTGDRGNHLVLIEYNEHQVTMPVISDDAVNNLAGKKIVITQINGNALTGTANTNTDDTFDDRLAAEKVTIAADQSTVTISSENSADLVWEFEATGTAGKYYIKHVATGMYLHIYDGTDGKDGEPNKGGKPLTLEKTQTPQAIEVHSANDGNTVWIKYPVLLYAEDDNVGNDNDYNVIDYYGDGVKQFGVWNKSSADWNNKFLLSEYSDLPMMDAVDPSAPAPLGNLDGKTMVITAANYNAAMSNNPITEKGNNNRGWLEAQEVKENNGVLSVATDAKLADVSWKFTSVPNGEANQYYIQDSTGKYLNISAHTDTVHSWGGGSGQVTLSGTKQPISVYLKDDGTFRLSAMVDGKEYILDFGADDNAFSAWQKGNDTNDTQNKFKLIPIEQFDVDSPLVTNLNGKTLALVGIHDGNLGTKRMALTSDTKPNNNYLQGVEVSLSGTAGKAYKFDDSKFTASNELWTFEAVANKLGVYYIKAANDKYLNIGDKSATVSDDKQEITVLSDTVVGGDHITYEVVYLRATVNGKEVYLRRELSGDDTGFYGADTGDLGGFPERRIVLAQPSTIYIDLEKKIDENNEDWLYKPQFKDGSTFKEEIVVDGGTLPVSGELNAEPVANTRTIKTQHFVSFNFGESLAKYVDRGGKGRDFPQAYMASWAPGLDALDGHEDGHIDRDKIDDKAFIDELRKNVYDPDFKGESPYWGVEYELTHYEVILPDGSTLKDDSGNNAKFAPGTDYTVTADGMIAITGVDGTTYKVPYGSTFKAQYREFSDILTFYINLYGVVADISADIQPRYIEDFTLGLAIAHIYNPGQYAGDTDESYDDANDYINSLFKGAYGENVDPNVMHAVIDGFITRENTLDNGEGSYNPEYRDNDHVFSANYPRYLSAKMTPALGASAAALAAHVLDYVRNVPDIDIMLKKYVSGNNEDQPTLNNKTIDTATFEVRWYVVKDQGDSWHIDGVMVGKTEPIPVTKTFYGLEKGDVERRVNYNSNNTVGNYQIGVNIISKVPVIYYNMLPYDQDYKESVIGKNEKGEVYCKDSNLNAAADGLYTYNGGSNPYNWTMSAILGQQYQLDEQNYDFQYEDENGELQDYDRVSRVTVKNKDGSTSTDTFGTSATVIGGTTASVEFNNYYTKHETGMFIVKKISSVTGLPLAGAEFTLYDSNGKTLYTEITDADGEVSFYNLEDGTYYLEETKAPDGFTASQTTWTIVVAEQGKVTYEGNATDGNLLYDFNEGTNPTFKPLEITNAPAETTVKVIKQFVGISKDQVDSLAENYSIVMQPKVDGNKTYTLMLNESGNAKPVVSADGLTYTWTLTNVPEIEYIVTESQFKLKNYVTTVSVEGFKDGDYTTSVTDPVVANNTAIFNATFDKDHEDGFTIYNSYANDFSMQITKVDSEGKKPLSGAEFKVYGAHFISTSPENVVVGDQTLYYLGTVITDANGNATFTGWTDTQGVFHKLVLGYPYALVETKAPDGYNLLTEPIYLGVVNAEGVYWGDEETNPDPDNLVFSNGVYSITVPNEPGYILPETGGAGTQFYTFGGLLLMAVPLMYGYKRKRAWKGGEMA